MLNIPADSIWPWLPLGIHCKWREVVGYIGMHMQKEYKHWYVPKKWILTFKKMECKHCKVD